MLEEHSDDDFSSASDEENESATHTSNKQTVTLEREKNRFQTEDKPFWEAYNILINEVLTVNSANSEETYMMSISNSENGKLTTIKTICNGVSYM